MQIKIWLRPGARPHDITIRLDYKCETRDTPRISSYGERLLKALEGFGGAAAAGTVPSTAHGAVTGS